MQQEHVQKMVHGMSILPTTPPGQTILNVPTTSRLPMTLYGM